MTSKYLQRIKTVRKFKPMNTVEMREACDAALKRRGEYVHPKIRRSGFKSTLWMKSGRTHVHN